MTFLALRCEARDNHDEVTGEPIVRLTYEATHGRAGHTVYSFGRVPRLAVFEDGRVIACEQWSPQFGLSIRHIDREDAWRIADTLFRLGVKELESVRLSSSECIYDSAIVHLRVVSRDGRSAQVRICNQPTRSITHLIAIKSFLDAEVKKPGVEYLAIPKAALFVRAVPEGWNSNGDLRSWPLGAEYLQRSGGSKMSVHVVEGKDLETLLGSTTHLFGEFWYTHNGSVYETDLIPWLPGEDYSRDMTDSP